jgi:polar amino acid transport system permease protein
LIILLFYAGTTALNNIWPISACRRDHHQRLAAAVTVLAIVQGAYQTEVFRGAIISIPKGQIEAARAYGMPPMLRLRRV